MNDNVIYTETDAGLNRFFAKIYSLVGMGVGLSAFVSYLMLFPFRENLISIISQHPFVYYGAAAVELILVFIASSAAQRNTPMALPIFLIYSALNGFTLSFIIAAYTGTTVLEAFVSSAAVFFAMAFIGARVKKDLSGMRKAMMAALIGIILASVINIFMGSGTMSFIISIISVLIFSGLIASDNQMIKRVYEANNGQVGDGWAVAMALSLYLDFINLFISLLRIFGRND
ncbi:Bax inhibitor-1/YccA family protein [Streptococcus uberis]|uniref:Bax inhibitor-1/YccA family protein n=1 Tax=Streptococcus uberis TaxID=1349 RepID=UPI001FF4E612|nr:Bax inhibitor-1/YccA family protein [Streptococcus uberis]MCK1188408.1 Bax inhibitor-1/YccA family protein [Streptococcus uberis]MCK1190269.1 Bax inhibitor-1/YccA family protein [Streptococcus uberis]MCK1207154.1 Bax inhibitor-1/YccA family protein [Streptococcus uberis]MCK1208354.1 Bax inhibitor-1/YccA family protein [Streptococcus uberis]MCK1242252.1 Bax inhibitor-1/YccA family protein [Streptococcus uberis]